MKSLLISTVVAAALAAPAFAESRPVPVRGAVESYEPGKQLVVLGRDGEQLAIQTPDSLQVVSIIPRKVSDIAVGDAVSTTAVPNEAGGLTALQVSILPAQLAGANEGQHPWDAAPDSVMTNARISGVAAGSADNSIIMTYADQTVTMDVPENAPVVAFGAGDASLLTKGADVFIVAMQAQDGTLSTNRVIAETNGVKPPM